MEEVFLKIDSLIQKDFKDQDIVKDRNVSTLVKLFVNNMNEKINKNIKHMKFPNEDVELLYSIAESWWQKLDKLN